MAARAPPWANGGPVEVGQSVWPQTTRGDCCCHLVPATFRRALHCPATLCQDGWAIHAPQVGRSRVRTEGARLGLSIFWLFSISWRVGLSDPAEATCRSKLQQDGAIAERISSRAIERTRMVPRRA